MNDIFHQWGTDLCLGPTGDIAIAGGPDLTKQRVLRRLLTSPMDYVWHPTYGAGLGSFVGEPANDAQIGAVIRGQVLKEASVAHSPPPVINVVSSPGDATGYFYVDVVYSDIGTDSSQTLGFSVGT